MSPCLTSSSPLKSAAGALSPSDNIPPFNFNNAGIDIYAYLDFLLLSLLWLLDKICGIIFLTTYQKTMPPYMTSPSCR